MAEKRGFVKRLTDEEAEELEKKESKVYYVLYFANDNEEDLKSWEKCIGRTATYEFIKSMIDYIDLDNSVVLVSGLDFNNSKSAYEFMDFVERKCKDIADPLFHIEDYK